LTSVPQMPPTSIFISAASSGMSGIGNSRSSVLLGPVRTAANTFSDTLAFLLGPSLRTLAGGDPAIHVLPY
jgi:hypothetical protein